VPPGELAYVRQFAADSTKPLPDTFTVMTYNIGYLSGMSNNLPVREEEDFYSERLRRAVALFQDIAPDFVGLQEIDFCAARSYRMNQLDSLAFGCGFAYAAREVNWDKRYVAFPYWPPWVHFGEIISGQAVLSRFPIVKQQRVVLPRMDRPFYFDLFYLDRLAQVVEVEIDGNKLVIINVHLEAYDDATREQQAAAVVKICERYTARWPMLLIGDFNSDPALFPTLRDDTIGIIRRDARLLPAFEHVLSADIHGTYPSQKPVAKIDYVFYNAEKIELLDRFVVQDAGDISDHLPVVMKFRFKTTGEM